MAGLGRLLAEGTKDLAAGIYKGLDNGGTARLTNKIAAAKGVSAEVASQKVMQRTGSQMGQIGTALVGAAPFQGIANTARDYMTTVKSQRSIMNSVKKGHMNGDSLNIGAVMGTAATVGVAGRVATGGGLYRDRYGNVNIPGLPFI